MSGDRDEKKYTAFKIDREEQVQNRVREAMERARKALEQARNSSVKIKGTASLSERLFFEIEVGPSKTDRPAPKPEKIKAPEKDPIRERFYAMREIARQNRSTYLTYSHFYDGRVQSENARIFYKQAEYMADFEDDHPGNAEFSSYFPTYQMMGYEQLRTYFTWRTKVRRGEVNETSLSYAFLYIYELLNNVGVSDPAEGLEKLMSFWRAYREFDTSVDRYVLMWLKDYHIYYELPRTFKEFAEENGLTDRYPGLSGGEKRFPLYCAISKYDIRKSAFFTPENEQRITDCVEFVIDRVRGSFEGAGLHFDDMIFWPTKKLSPWTPFKGAVFCNRQRGQDRKVILSSSEIYVCTKGEWTYSPYIAAESGRKLVGYIMKQTEALLRKLMKYKYKLAADVSMLDPAMFVRLQRAGLNIESMVESAVTEFYREATKTVVTVDRDNLRRIREEALTTQEALLVEEEAVAAPARTEPSVSEMPEIETPIPQVEPTTFVEAPATPTAVTPSDEWSDLRDALSGIELDALGILLKGGDIRAFADRQGVMLEVLADGINEKAADIIGDNILDEELAVYEDYEEQVREMAEAYGE